uniref:Uncharacterized protein n=1 Tax=Siphoviridae sp. ctqSm5 TaxID=2827949 RepID=A0A8S5SPG2_9CAUD|nr:MAG TPA: hypothetical protein [Siphoviridae sp. ctqSm5]
MSRTYLNPLLQIGQYLASLMILHQDFVVHTICSSHFHHANYLTKNGSPSYIHIGSLILCSSLMNFYMLPYSLDYITFLQSVTDCKNPTISTLNRLACTLLASSHKSFSYAMLSIVVWLLVYHHQFILNIFNRYNIVLFITLIALM